MDLERLKALIDLVSNTRVAELEIVENGCRIRIVASEQKGGDPVVSVSQVDPPPGESADTGIRHSEPETGTVVRAPLYGVLHLEPAPGAEPFVSVGDAVDEGQTLCIIESMKVLNPILAVKAGTVAAILIESGAEVEPGQPLVRIE
jgi:acetyl-CoA carboxylase biotin carboxyl carrier protein